MQVPDRGRKGDRPIQRISATVFLRPISPVLTPGGMRGAPLQMQTTDAAARWAAAALRGSFLPGSRGLASGFSGHSMLQGSGKCGHHCDAVILYPETSVKARMMFMICIISRVGAWLAVSVGRAYCKGQVCFCGHCFAHCNG